MRIAARDLVGRSFPESLAELSDLADGCLAAAARCTARETGFDPSSGPPPIGFALGKLGGRELNFSSDVDLVFLYESAQGEVDPDLFAETRDTIFELPLALAINHRKWAA